MHHARGCRMIIFPHHQAPRENADTTFKDAHVYVHFKASYILPLEKGSCKSYDRWIRAT